MSKKQKALEAQEQLNRKEKEAEIASGTLATANDKNKKKQEKGKDKKKKDKKQKKGGLIKKTKETASELKKVTWPSFGEVVKKTGIVIAFVLIFALVIFGVDTLLGWLVGLLIG